MLCVGRKVRKSLTRECLREVVSIAPTSSGALVHLLHAIDVLIQCSLEAIVAFKRCPELHDLAASSVRCQALALMSGWVIIHINPEHLSAPCLLSTLGSHHMHSLWPSSSQAHCCTCAKHSLARETGDSRDNAECVGSHA